MYLMRLVLRGGPSTPDAHHGQVLGVVEATAAFPLNDTPTLTFTVDTDVHGGHSLAEVRSWLGNRDIGVEVNAGTGTSRWVEPHGGRFVLISDSCDVHDSAGLYKFTALGVDYDLSGVPNVNPATLNKEGKRAFKGATAGKLLRDYMATGQGAGLATAVSFDFTATHDSAGVAWPNSFEMDVEPATTARQLLDQMVTQGLCDWRFEGNVLQMYAPGRTMDSLRSTELRLGRDLDSGQDERTLDSMVDKVLVLGDKGNRVVRNSTTPNRSRGDRAAVQNQGGVSDVSTLQMLADNMLASSSLVRGQITRDLNLDAQAASLPFINYFIGDTIWASGQGGNVEDLRVYQVTLQISGANGDLVTGNIVLGDRLLERAVREARRLDGLMGGATISGGSGSTPAPIPPPPPTPAKVTGSFSLTFTEQPANRRVYWLGQLNWQAVTQDVDAMLLTVDGYQLRGRRVGETEWHDWGINPTNSKLITYLEQGAVWQIQIRAMARGVFGEWSASQEFVVPADTTPPGSPSTPELRSESGIMFVKWDGTDAGGGPASFDVDYVEVHVDGIGALATLPWAGGETTLSGLEVGAFVSVFLIAVDTAGNRSLPSPSATLKVASVLDDTGLAEALAAIDSETASVRALAQDARDDADAAVVSANGKNSRTRSLNPPSEADAVGRVDGDTWWQLDSFITNNAIGQWVLAGDVWVLENFKSEVIANLDVSKLTATTAIMDSVAARKMVSDFGSFKLLTAEKLVIAADNMVPNGSLEFGDSRGWDPVYTYSTDAPTGYPGSVWRQGGTTFVGLPDIPVTPGVDYLFEVWVKADKAGSVLYMEVRDRPNGGASLGFYEIGSSTRASRPIEGWSVPTVWTKVTRVMRVPENVHTIYMDKFFFNHSSGTVGDATVFIAGMRMRAMTGGDLVVDGSITGRTLNIDEAFAVKLKASFGQFDTLKSGFIEGVHIKGTAIDGFTITAPTIQTVTTANRGLKITKNEHLRAWDGSGNQTVHINGTSNYMVGEFRTNRAGAGPGVVLVNTTSAGSTPGIWFSSTTQALGADAAIYSDSNNRLIIRGNTSGGVQPVWFPGSVEAYQYVGVKDSVNGTARAILDVSGAGRTGRVVADAAVFNNLSTRSGSKVDVWNHLSLQYITTVSLASNMFIDANQFIYKIGSARKLKINIQDQATEFDPWALLNVPARIWSDRAEVEARRDKMNGVENTLGVEAYGRIPGVVAEEVAEAGLEQFVTRNPETGEVEGVMYDRLWTPLIPIVKDLLARVEALEPPTIIEGEIV